MTLLEERPEVESTTGSPTPAPVDTPVPDTWLTTADHKRLGLMFVYAALLFLIAGGVIGLIMGAKQVAPGLNLAADRWLRLYGLHTQMTVLLFLTAVWFGLATYVVPLQIGAGRLALPRLLATGFWTYLVGGGCLIASYISGAVNTRGGLGGITQPHPVQPIPGGANSATVLWVVSLGLIAVGFLLSSVSLFTTVAALRTDGMTLLRVPAFSWATMVAAGITMLATPVFLGGLLMLGIDQRFGGSLFAPADSAATGIWTHTVWLFGRPDVFLLTLVAVGAATDVVTTHARRPLLNHQAGLVLLGVFGVLSLTAFASDASIADAVIIPTATVLTALVAAPLGLLVLLWLGTTALGRPRFHVSVLFVVGAILLWVCSAANVLAAGVKSLDGLHGNNAWVAGNVHVAVAGAPTLLAVGAIYHWAPKIWGRTLNAGVGSLAFLALLGGFLASGLAYYFLGYNGASLGQLSDLTSYQKGLYGLAEGGGGLIVAGVLLVVLDLLVSIVAGRGKEAGDDPYESLTLEWATTSPPPLAGFESVPEVRSEAPLVDVRAAEVS